MDIPDPKLPTITKQRIHELYMGLSRITAYLQAWVTGNSFDDGYFIFMDFRKGFLELYELSKRYELNPTLKKEIEKWIEQEFETSAPQKKDVWNALALYSKLIDELVNRGKLEV